MDGKRQVRMDGTFVVKHVDGQLGATADDLVDLYRVLSGAAAWWSAVFAEMECSQCHVAVQKE